MESRSTTFVRLMLHVLLLPTLVVCLGVGALIAAGPAHAGPTAGPFAPMQSLQALLAVQQAQLTAGDGAAADYFGYSVAISGNTAVVGALGAEGLEADSGAAYVFVRSGTTWSQQAKLTAADGTGVSNFGVSVAISGDTAVVGARGADGAEAICGAAYVFVRSGTTWSQQAKLTAADGTTGDNFGSSVAISGDTAVVGATRDDIGANVDQGSAYIFVRSGTTWSQQQKLTASDGAADDWSGSAVAISGDTAVVGYEMADIGANVNQGAVYVFVRSGTTWSEQQKLTPADGFQWEHFGCSTAIRGSTLVAGAKQANVGANVAQGAVYVFVRSGSTWSQQQKLTASDGAAEDYFGWSVALSGDTAVVGARHDTVGANAEQGSAYVFTRCGAKWSQFRKLTAGDGAAEDSFGYSAAISGATVVIGALGADVGTNAEQGVAYVFRVAKPGRPVAESPKGWISSRTPTFRWTAAAGAATYQVRVYKASRVIRTKTGITNLSWKLTRGLPRGVWLTWKVRAHNAGGWSAWSNMPRFKVR